MVARASRADLPKTLWKQEKEGKGQKDGRRAGDNEREKYSGESGVWPWLRLGLGVGACQGFGLDSGIGWYFGQRMRDLRGYVGPRIFFPI